MIRLLTRIACACALLVPLGCGDDGGCPPGLMRSGGGCVPADGGMDCSGEEICDGFDNDCDGDIDENLFRSCGVTMGVCTEGREVCTAGEFGECTGIAPTEEDCLRDGDEDCDGTVDEGCGPCTEGTTRSCGSDVGACVFGSQVCESGGSWASECTGGADPGMESCNGMDDDCDGTVDEDTDGSACGLDVGLCVPGILRCIGGVMACDDAVEPTDELCNGEDDDCDGMTDEGATPAWYPDVDGDGFGDADATPMMVCDRPAGFVDNADDCDDACDVCWTGATEMCDGEDNDCSGMADTDEFACTQGASVSCTTSCGSMGSGACSDSCTIPGLATCMPPAEVCDYADTDCDDLVDEGVRSFGTAGSPAGNDVDEVRVLPTDTGFALFTLRGSSLRVQRLDQNGTPQGSTTDIDLGGVNTFDVATIQPEEFVVAWRELTTVRARLVTVRGGTISLGTSQVIETDASAFVGVAVAASPTQIYYAMGDPQADLFLARTSDTLGSLVSNEVLAPSRIDLPTGSSLRQLEMDESGGEFVLAWEADDGAVRWGRVSDGFGLVLLDVGTATSGGSEPILADDGSGNRVVGWVSGTGRLRFRYLDSGATALRGASTGYDVMAADTSLRQRAAATHSDGTWLFVGHSGNTIAVREYDDAGGALGTETQGSTGIQSLDIDARSGGRHVVAVGRAAATQSYLYGCP